MTKKTYEKQQDSPIRKKTPLLDSLYRLSQNLTACSPNFKEATLEVGQYEYWNIITEAQTADGILPYSSRYVTPQDQIKVFDILIRNRDYREPNPHQRRTYFFEPEDFKS